MENSGEETSLINIKRLVERLPMEQKAKLTEDILQEIPIEIKANLINKELGDCGLVVILDNRLTTSEIATHIKYGEIDLSEIMQAMAQRIKKI